MANPWFRLYSEFADDPKVQSMPEHMQRRLIMLFCSRCKEEKIPETLRAFHWRIGPVEMAETKSLFMENGFIDDKWNLLNWNKRQFLSDSSADRTRRYRDRLKRHSDGDVTKGDVLDTDTEQIKKQTKSSRVKREAKPPTKTDINKSRHAEFKSAIGAYWQARNPGIEMPWAAPEGRTLEIWLRSCPTTTIEQFRGFLRNRFKSDVNHTERPSRWINNIMNFAAEPLDKFGKPKSLNGGTNGHATEGKYARLEREALEIVAREEADSLSGGTAGNYHTRSN